MKGGKGEGEKGRRGEGEKGRRGEREKGRKGEREKGRKGEREKGRKGEREKGRKGEGEKGRKGGKKNPAELHHAGSYNIEPDLFGQFNNGILRNFPEACLVGNFDGSNLVFSIPDKLV